jgi:predicted nucleotidyltransferase
MEEKTRHTIPAPEPLAAYWTAEDLPAMPRFLRTLITQAQCRLHVTKILLFGSRARRDCRPTSDYDLAFLLEDTQGWARFVTEQQEEAGTLLPLDLVNFHAAPASLQDEIRASGIVLYEQ